VWSDYLKRSIEQMRIDRESLAAELKPGQAAPPPPVAGRNGDHQMPFDREPAWYASPEARRIADTVVSFQTPAGGWSKNQGRAGPPRLPGQRYNNNAETMEPNPANFDAPRDRYWTYVGTLDNGATTTELRYLARVAAQIPGKDGELYRESFLKGVRYLLAAQYPNGGWPQIYPLQGGYHDAVTFNDNAVAEAAMLLEDVALGKSEFAFVPSELRAQAGASSRRGVEVILASQVIVDGNRTIWPQQADPLTLQPSSARNYEPRSLATTESTDLLLFLMRQPKPSPAIKAAVRDAVSWLKAHEIYDIAWAATPDGRQRVAKPGAGPLWSRNYDIATGQPIFGDRDKRIHDDVNEISLERRNGYAWYSDAPRKAIKAFERWSQDNGSSP
jgi:PelA/Pel-15E family pectate lyase